VNIAHVLRQQAAERGDAPAIIDVRNGRGRVTSFRALESAAARFAEQISRRGVGAGDAVLILHPMAAELYAFLIALFRLGAVAMFVDPSAGSEFVERCLREHPPKAFFGSLKAHLLRLRVPAMRQIGVFFCAGPLPGTAYLALHRAGPERTEIVAAEAETPALITFTSGSTGAPKGAVRTHGFLLAQHHALAHCMQHSAGAMDLTTLPVFVLANLASGVTSVIPDADLRRPGRIAPRPVLRQLERWPISSTAASPAFISRLTDQCQRRGMRVEGLKRVFMGGAPVFPEDLREAQKAFPEAQIVAVYGSTEAEPMAEVALNEIAKADFEAMAGGKGLLAGKPVEEISLRVMRDGWGTAIAPADEGEFKALGLDSGEVGEIVVAGEHVLPGYLNGVGDAENKIRVDETVWHRTGDLGWMDEQGRLWLMGRASAAIRDRRGVLYPFAVECAARQVGGVRRAAAIVVEGRRILVLEAGSQATADAVRAALRWADIDEVRFVRAIPMDKRHNAKIDYAELRKMI
jgi:olefin beta-lactone synthetase